MTVPDKEGNLIPCPHPHTLTIEYCLDCGGRIRVERTTGSHRDGGDTPAQHVDEQPEDDTDGDVRDFRRNLPA